MKLTELKIDNEDAILLAPMLEMANLSSKDTGLSVFIWFGKVGGQHGPRIKISNTKGRFNETDNFVISVEKEPRILTTKSVKLKKQEVDDVIDWVKLNYDVLMKLWHAYENDEGTIELLGMLKKI